MHDSIVMMSSNKMDFISYASSYVSNHIAIPMYVSPHLMSMFIIIEIYLILDIIDTLMSFLILTDKTAVST